MTALENLESYGDIRSTPESPQGASCSLSPKIVDRNQEQIAGDSPIKSEISPVKECPLASKKYRVEKYQKGSIGNI